MLHWNILGENDEGEFFQTMSPCIIWPEAVAYQTSFEGDFKRIMFKDPLEPGTYFIEVSKKELKKNFVYKVVKKL